MRTLWQFSLTGQLISLFFLICQGCLATPGAYGPLSETIRPAAERTELYLPLLKGRKVGLIVNHTSLVGNVHLADTLKRSGIEIKTLFSPEHGIRGQADAGATVDDGLDPVTGIRVISLYGSKKKPSAEDLAGIDMLVFDIQDVGVRFFTYISTLHYMMEAAAMHSIPLMVLDRPNPNGHYIDGPVLDTAWRSFVGMHPIPVVYGMTIGELARMINGEKWIPKSCDLTVIPCDGYDHTRMYELPVRPSPNLPNLRAILLYPGICFFEGTPLSLGRGTSTPFQVVGHPDYSDHTFSFRPSAIIGAMNPPLKDQTCYGVDLSALDVDSLFAQRRMDLSVLFHFYGRMDKATFFNRAWFDKLAGTSYFREKIEDGWTEEEIRTSWKKELEAFNEKRRRYLLYIDF